MIPSLLARGITLTLSLLLFLFLLYILLTRTTNLLILFVTSFILSSWSCSLEFCKEASIYPHCVLVWSGLFLLGKRIWDTRGKLFVAIRLGQGLGGKESNINKHTITSTYSL